MLTIQIIDHERGVSKIAEIPTEQAPAFRAAIQEVRDELGDRISARYKYDHEAAWTRGIMALGAFAAALNVVVPVADPKFGPRAHMWPDEPCFCEGVQTTQVKADEAAELKNDAIEAGFNVAEGAE